MENIVESLFGLSPWQVQQQQNAGMDAYASNQASKSLLQRSSENYGRAGGMFAQAGAEAMGMVNPQVEQAKQRQAMLGGLEPNAESIRQRALQISDPKLKFQLLAYANQLDEKEQAKKLAAAQLKNAIDPSAKPARKDFTAESWKVYERTGKQSDLVEAANAPKIEAGKTRTYQKGQDSITEELQADGTWKQLGIGPKFSKQVINVNAGSNEDVMGLVTDDTLDMDAWRYLTDGTLPPNMGRGVQGAKQAATIRNKSAALAKTMGMEPSEIRFLQLENKAQVGALAQLARAKAQILQFEKTASNNADLALEASNKVWRTGSPFVNKPMQWLQSEAAGDPGVKVFNAANETFVSEYARVMSGGYGAAQTTEGSQQRAHKLLATASTKEQYTQVIAQLKREMANRVKALNDQMTEERGNLRRGIKSSPKPTEAEKPVDNADEKPTATVSNW